MKKLKIVSPEIFDRIAEVKAKAKLSVVATDRINPWAKYWLRYGMDDANDEMLCRYLVEMKNQGQVINASRSKLIWAPEPLYGPPMVVAVQDSQSECDFRVLTQGETLAAHRIGGFQYICVNVVSGDEDSLFLAAVYDNTENRNLRADQNLRLVCPNVSSTPSRLVQSDMPAFRRRLQGSASPTVPAFLERIVRQRR